MITDKDYIIELLRQREDLQCELSDLQETLKTESAKTAWRDIPDDAPKLSKNTDCPDLADSYNNMVKSYLAMRTERDELAKVNKSKQSYIERITKEIADIKKELEKARPVLGISRKEKYDIKTPSALTIESSKPMHGYNKEEKK